MADDNANEQVQTGEGDGVANILAPIRDDRDTDWAVAFLAKLHQRERIRVHLLSVQAPYNGHVRMFFKDAQVHAFQREDAEKELAPVCSALDRAGVPYNKHVIIGYAAEEIARFAQQHHCRQIVMGPPKGRGLSELVLGSLGQQVEHLMRVSGRTCEVL